jgi:hypothetical protein
LRHNLLRPSPGKHNLLQLATAAATVAADYKDKMAALTLTITGMKEKALYF